AADYTADHRHRGDTARMAGRTCRPAQSAAVPDPPRRPAQPRRATTTTRFLYRHRHTDLPDSAWQADLAPRAAPLCRDAAARRRRRHHRDRTVVGPRTRRHHTDLRPRGSRPQGEGVGSHHTPTRRARPLPTLRYRPCIPRRPVDYADYTWLRPITRSPLWTPRSA